MVTIQDLPAEDVLYAHIFKYLALEDVVNLRRAGREFEPLVDGYLEQLKYIEWDVLTPNVLKILGMTTQNLREVDVSMNRYINDSYINPILLRNKEVNTIIMRACCQVSVNGIHPMLHYKNLTHLNLRRNAWVVDSFLHLLTVNLNSELLYIDLSLCNVSDTSLVPFFQKYKKLRNIDLEMVPLVSDRTIFEIARNCRDLVNFNIIWNKQIGEKSIRAVVSSCTKLSTLMIIGCGVSQQFKDSLPHLIYHE